MQTILITAAMAEEMALIDYLFPPESSTQMGPFEYHEAYVNNNRIISTVSGIGKVNTAVCTTLAVQCYQPSLLVNAGVSGGVHPEVNIGDVVLASELKYHDADATTFGYQPGQIPRMPTHYVADPTWISRLLAYQSELPFQLFAGLITSSDSFIADETWRIEILTRFPDLLALDMESCAIAQTCHQLKIPFLCIRGISDSANRHSKSYQEALGIALGNVAILLRKVLEHIG